MKYTRGFTFIELILYIGLVTIVLSTLVPFAWNAIQTGVKSGVQQEVNANVRYISERIKYEIRNAVAINSVTPTSISLATSTPATNPTIISFASGNLTIQQGTGSAVQLNTVNTVLNQVIFTNYTSLNGSSKNIQFSLTIASSFPGVSQEYQNTVVVEGDAELRSN